MGRLGFAACSALFAVAVSAGCGRTKPASPGGTGGTGAIVDAGSPLGEAGLVTCLDQPGQLAMPPTRTLPCDLFPPGMARSP